VEELMKRALIIVFVFSLGLSLVWAQAPQGAQGERGQAGQAAPGTAEAPRGRGGRAPLVPVIQSFDASPRSIKPGESFVLSWSTESGAGTIDNGIGTVAPRGTIRITPKATSTYTLSMGGGAVTRSVTVTVAGTTPVAAAAAAAADRQIPRIDGKPDFSGVYGFGAGGRGRGAAAPPPASPYANLPAQAALKPGAVNRGGNANPAGGTADCMPLPVDRAFGVPYPFQIIQSRNYFVFFHEYPGTFRIVPLDGQPLPMDPDPTWLGESAGRWEGDTLVIETIGFNGKLAIGGIQQPSEKFRTIERLTHTSPTTVFYEIIFEDPEIAAGPWRSTRTFNLDTRPGVNKIMEFVCENNRDYLPLFGPEGPPRGGGGRGARGGDQPQRGGQTQ
jgi:hypothetical protein